MKKILVSVMLLSAMIISSCNKGQILELYSKQGQLEQRISNLEKAIDKTNTEIQEIQKLIAVLKAQKLVSDIQEERATVNGIPNVLVAKILTIGEVKLRIPFGQDGRPGEDAYPPIISIDPEKGTWLIDGVDQGIPAVAKTPILGTAKDESNPADQRLYWTIKYGENETAQFLKDSQGNKLIAKDPALVVSPVLDITKNEDNRTIVIRTNIAGLEEVVLPYRAIDKVFNLDFTTLVDDQGATSTSSYEASSNTLSFKTSGQTLSFSYTKSEDIADVSTSSNYRGFTIRIDKDAKTISITAPTFSWDKIASEYEFIFTAQDATRATFTRTLKVSLKSKLYLSFFFNENPAVKAFASNSIFNQLSLASNLSYTHRSDWFDFNTTTAKYAIRKDSPFSYERTKVEESEMLTQLKKPVYREVEKTIEVEDKDVVLIDAIFDPARIKTAFVGSNGQEETVASIEDFALLALPLVEEGEATENATMVYYKPLPWDTYIALTSFRTGFNSEAKTIMLERAVMKYELSIEDPAKLFALNGTAFDKSKLNIYVQNEAGRYYDLSKPFVRAKESSKLAVVKIDATLAEANGAAVLDFDTEKKLLTASFSTFPSSNPNAYSLALEYSKDDNTKLVKVFRVSAEDRALGIPMGGSILSFTYKAESTTEPASMAKAEFKLTMPTRRIKRIVLDTSKDILEAKNTEEWKTAFPEVAAGEQEAAEGGQEAENVAS